MTSTISVDTELSFHTEYISLANLFDKICTLDIRSVKKEVIKKTPNVFSMLADQRGRFRIWAGNTGANVAGKASLQHRLREAPHIRPLVHELLKKLGELLTEGVCPCIFFLIYVECETDFPIVY